MAARSGSFPPLSAPARALLWFWAAVGTGLVCLVLLLAWLGPPPAAPGGGPVTAAAGAGKAPIALPSPSRAPGMPIPGPDPALLEPDPDDPARVLPRIGPEGQEAREAYAAGFDRRERRPRVAILITGAGLSRSDTAHAIETLPAAVSFAFSPYADDLEAQSAAARGRGHEVLVALPLEPENYPLHDPGPEALLSGARAEDNARRLRWALSRFTAYVGATGALGAGLHGERFAAEGGLLDALEQSLAGRGLLYVDPRPGAPPPARVAGRTVDRVIGVDLDAAAIDAALAALVDLAKRQGAALALVDAPSPALTARLAAWAGGLGAQDIALAPVSALATPPGSPPRANAASAPPASPSAAAETP
jgi:polysaccharide deacetylase 2 family uncharacterized protein YibQ